MKRSAAGAAARAASGGKGGDFFSLKDVGTAVIHIHGNRNVGDDCEIEERRLYRVPADPQDGGSGGKRRQRGYKRVFYARDSDPNPMQDLLDALREDDAIESSEVVLVADATEYTKGDVLGEGDWKASCLPSTEFLWAVVVSSAGETKATDPKVQILACPPSLCEAIDGVIDTQVREHGEEEGEASVAGYGIEISYDEDAAPSKKYTAQFNGRKASPKIRELLDGDGVDLARFCGPPDVDEMRRLIGAALRVEVEGFDVRPEGKAERRGGAARGRTEPERPARRGGEKPREEAPPARRTAAKKPEPEPEPEEVDEEPEPTDEEPEEDEAGEDGLGEEDQEPEPEPEPEPPKRAPKAAPKPDPKAKPTTSKPDPKASATKDPGKDAAASKANASKDAAASKAKPTTGGKGGGAKAPAGDEVEVNCPKCKALVKVSAAQKVCVECGHKIIPW